MPNSVIVTGAAGFIGSHTVDRLLAEGHDVVAIDNLSTGHLENLESHRNNPRLRLEIRDIIRPNVLSDLCRQTRPSAIIHLAGLVSVTKAEQDPWLNFRLNVKATQVVGEAARLHGVPRIVFASSAATYGDIHPLPLREDLLPQPASLYGAAKLASEQLLSAYHRAFALETISLRYFNVYGPRQDPSSPYSGVISIFVDRFLQGSAIEIFGTGEQTRDFVSVLDVARANVIAATRPGFQITGPVNVCTGRQQSLRALLGLLGALFGSSPECRYGDFRRGDILHSGGDASLAQRALGFRSTVSLKEGLANLIASLPLATA